MTADDTVRIPRILAGPPATGRRRFPRAGSVERWFEPDHVRDPGRVRDEMAAQVRAGADVLEAPTFLTHRRALLAVGESRRAREWTMAAVRVARDAADAGLELRAQDEAQTAELPADERPVVNPDVLIVGVLPDLELDSDPGTGRLAPRETAVARDEADLCGFLADAGVDGILLEPRATVERASASVGLAAETGIPAWAMVSLQADARLVSGEALEMWVEAVGPLAPASVIVMPADASNAGRADDLVERLDREVPGSMVGVVAPGPLDGAGGRETAKAWLEAGAASVIGIADGASPDALRPLVEARGDVTRTQLRRVGEARSRWERWVTDAARRAPGGAAMWIGAPPPRLPDGFAWTVTMPDEAASAPDEAFRFIVSREPVDALELGRLLERGGILAARLPPGVDLSALANAGLRPLDGPAAVDPSWVMARKER
jgi:hypothetical protein